eukprot:scaffold75375_cov65-Phaeocystis_antarctica.AAC.8
MLSRPTFVSWLVRHYTSRPRQSSHLGNRLERRRATHPASTAPIASALALALALARATALALAPALTAAFARHAAALTSLATTRAAAEAAEALGAWPRRPRGCSQRVRVRERPLREELREAGRRRGREAAEPRAQVVAHGAVVREGPAEVVGGITRVEHVEHVVPARVRLAWPAAQHLQQQIAEVGRGAVRGRVADDDEEQVRAQPAVCGVVPAVLLEERIRVRVRVRVRVAGADSLSTSRRGCRLGRSASWLRIHASVVRPPGTATERSVLRPLCASTNLRMETFFAWITRQRRPSPEDCTAAWSASRSARRPASLRPSTVRSTSLVGKASPSAAEPMSRACPPESVLRTSRVIRTSAALRP